MPILAGWVVTLDAMGCRKTIARRTREQPSDPVLRVRENRKGLLVRTEDTFALERAGCFHDHAETVGTDHGRIRARYRRAMGDPDHLAHVFPNRAGCALASPVRVGCERRGGNRVATVPRFFMSSLPPRPSCCKRCESMGASKTPATGSWTGRQPRPHGPCRPQHEHPRRIVRTAPPGSVPGVGITHKRLAAAWNQDCPCRLIGLGPKTVKMQSPRHVPY